jgi:nitroreductase
MSLQELAKNRKTVRKFNNAIPDIKEIEYCINVAREAPSGKNDQPWMFIIVDNEQIKLKIREICERGEKEFYKKSNGRLKKWLDKMGFSWEKPFLSEAPYLIVVLSYKKAPFSKESVWLSIGYLLLALEEKGLSTVTYTPSKSDELYKLLNIGNDYKIETILPIGYSIDDKPKYERKELKDVVSYNDFKNSLEG